MIHVTENYYLSADNYCIHVVERCTTQFQDKENYEYDKTIAYAKSLPDAMRAIQKVLVQDVLSEEDSSLEKLLVWFKGISDAIDTLKDDPWRKIVKELQE